MIDNDGDGDGDGLEEAVLVRVVFEERIFEIRPE